MNTNKNFLIENLNDIRAFVTVVKMESFTKAAENLHVSRAQISKQLSHLEKSLGVQLLIRTTRSQHLTPSGKTFFEDCYHALKQIDDAIQGLHLNENEMRGHISINCVGGIIGESLIANSIHHFCKKFPEITIDLDFSSEYINLNQSPFDLVIRMGKLPDSLFIARHLGDIKIGTYASPTYLQNKCIQHPRDLKSHQCLTGSITKWRYRSTLDAAEYFDIDVQGQLTCKNGYVLLNAALAGNGICRLPELYAEPYLEMNQLIPVFEDWKITDVPLHLLYRANQHRPIRLRTFIAHLCQTIHDELNTVENS